MTLTTNLIAYWKFDEGSGTTTADATGNGFTGTLTSSSQWTTSGKINDGLTFDGSTQYVNLGNSSTLNPTAGISLSAWVKFVAIPTGTQLGTLVGRDDNSLGRSFAFGWDAYTSSWDMQINGTNTALYASTPSTGVWYHAVCTADSATGVKIYLNGASVASAAWLAPASTTGNTTIGERTYASFEGRIHGTIDEVGMWSRALTSTEVSQLYNSGSGLAYPFTGGGGTPLFRKSLLNGLGSGGPFFNNPLGRSMLPKLVTA